MEAWYVAKAQPRKEAWLQSFLTSYCNVQVFWPRIRRPGRDTGAWESLFPTYLFCHLDVEGPSWPIVRWAPGLAYFLGYDGRPASVPHDMISYLEQRVAWWNEVGHCRPLNPGERVMVATGPMAGLEGIFQRYVAAHQRCRVLLKVMGRLTAVELPATDIRSLAHRLVLTA